MSTGAGLSHGGSAGGGGCAPPWAPQLGDSENACLSSLICGGGDIEWKEKEALRRQTPCQGTSKEGTLFLLMKPAQAAATKQEVRSSFPEWRDQLGRQEDGVFHTPQASRYRQERITQKKPLPTPNGNYSGPMVPKGRQEVHLDAFKKGSKLGIKTGEKSLKTPF